jgi:hypothetical protein
VHHQRIADHQVGCHAGLGATCDKRLPGDHADQSVVVDDGVETLQRRSDGSSGTGCSVGTCGATSVESSTDEGGGEQVVRRGQRCGGGENGRVGT